MKKNIYTVFLSATLLFGNQTSVTDSPAGPWEEIGRHLAVSAELAKTEYDTALYHAEAALKTAQEHELETALHAVYYRIANAYYFHENQDSAIAYYKRSLRHFTEKSGNDFRADVYLFLGNSVLLSENDHEAALEYFRKCYQFAQLNDNYRLMGAASSAAGNLFRVNGGYEKALEYILSSREHYEKAGFQEGLAWVDYLLGRLYGSMMLYDDAIHYTRAALEQYKVLAEIDGVYNGVSMALEQLSQFLVDINNFESAARFNQEAEEIYRKFNRKFGLAGVYLTSAEIKFAQGDDDRALDILDRSQKLKREINNNYGLATGYILYGRILHSQGQDEKAIDSLHAGLRIAANLNQVVQIVDIHKLLAEVYSAFGNDHEAYRHLNIRTRLTDSLSTVQSMRKMTQAQNLEMLSRKDAQIRLLEQEKQISQLTLQAEKQKQMRNSIAITALSVLILLILALLISQRRALLIRTAQNAKIEEQSRLLSANNLQLEARQKELEVVNADLTEAIHKAEDALSQVKTLSGLLPICSSCKKIRDDSGYWNQLEVYLANHSDVDFTHGICPECSRKLYPEIYGDESTDINKK